MITGTYIVDYALDSRCSLHNMITALITCMYVYLASFVEILFLSFIKTLDFYKYKYKYKVHII